MNAHEMEAKIFSLDSRIYTAVEDGYDTMIEELTKAQSRAQLLEAIQRMRATLETSIVVSTLKQDVHLYSLKNLLTYLGISQKLTILLSHIERFKVAYAHESNKENVAAFNLWSQEVAYEIDNLNQVLYTIYESLELSNGDNDNKVVEYYSDQLKYAKQKLKGHYLEELAVLLAKFSKKELEPTSFDHQWFVDFIYEAAVNPDQQQLAVPLIEVLTNENYWKKN